MKNSPIISALDFDKCFKLAVYACDIGAGAVLIQEDNNDLTIWFVFFSKKFNKHQKNYSTIQECLALILAIQPIEVNVSFSKKPVVVFSDHNPLKFLLKLKNKNYRLFRRI
jgi:hypothetical protein